MGQTIACANQKGGVGKTTTVVNLASYLALLGDRVLVIDLDPQGNGTSGLGVDRSTVERSIYDAIVDDVPLDQLVVRGTADRRRPRPVRHRARGRRTRARRRRWRASVACAASWSPSPPDYDVIFIDCPPSLGLLTVNALTAADAVLIPLQCEYYALEGLTQLLATIDLVRDHLNPQLALDGVVLTMYDARTNLSADVAAEARRHLGDAVYETSSRAASGCPRRRATACPITRYAPESRGAAAYAQLARRVPRAFGVGAQPPASPPRRGGPRCKRW